jgi:hypothetical protein
VIANVSKQRKKKKQKRKKRKKEGRRKPTGRKPTKLERRKKKRKICERVQSSLSHVDFAENFFLGTLDLANRIVTIVGKTKVEFDVLQCAASEIKSGEFSLTSAGFRFVLFLKENIFGFFV